MRLDFRYSLKFSVAIKTNALHDISLGVSVFVAWIIIILGPLPEDFEDLELLI